MIVMRTITAGLLNLAMVSLAWGLAIPYTNVKDFGATGNGTTNDTTAIRNAFISAAARSLTYTAGNNVSVRSQAVVFFPSGHYLINDNISINHVSVMGENGAVIRMQDNLTKNIFDIQMWRGVISGLSFVGGQTQINLAHGNTDQTHILVEKCQFANAAGAAIRTGTEAFSTQLTIRDCVFAQCFQTLVTYCDKAKFADCWITGSPAMANKAILENYGDLLCENICGVPGVTTGNDQRWIDNYRRVECRNFRFGGEGAGFTAVVNFAAYEYNPANLVPNGVVLDDCDIYSSGNLNRPCAIYCEEIPNQIVVRNCRGMPAASDPSLMHVVMVKPSLNLNTYFDNAENFSRPRCLRYLIDPATTELYHLQQLDLPEQMRPYQANAVEADARPTTGWWKAGAFVRNRNCTGGSTPFGWVCTGSGKPGTWNTVNTTFAVAGGMLQGNMILDSYASDLRYVGGQIDLRQGGISVLTDRLVLDSAGQFTLSGITAGTYDVAIKPSQGLRKTVAGVTVPSSGTAHLGTIHFTNADIDGDNTVTSSDLAMALANLDASGAQ